MFQSTEVWQESIEGLPLSKDMVSLGVPLYLTYTVVEWAHMQRGGSLDPSKTTPPCQYWYDQPLFQQSPKCCTRGCVCDRDQDLLHCTVRIDANGIAPNIPSFTPVFLHHGTYTYLTSSPSPLHVIVEVCLVVIARLSVSLYSPETLRANGSHPCLP